MLVKGTGTVHPTQKNGVTVNYAGWTTDGKMFDSSYTHGEPADVRRDRGVIPGWTEALQLMVEGEKRRIWIPEALAYKGQPQRPQGMLVFDVELLKILDTPPPPHGFPGGMGGMHMGPGGGMHPGMHPGMGGMPPGMGGGQTPAPPPPPPATPNP